MRWILIFTLSISGTAFAASNTVLVELFTSEGCSSCPSADKVLTQIHDRDDVAVLGWHVDYWDYLGWTDRFGHKNATPRQRAYGAALARGRVYTPQMVVNGEAEFVGSQSSTAERAIAKAANARNIPLSITMHEDAAIKCVIALGPMPQQVATDNLKAYVAVTEDKLVNDVKAGENRGKTLHHDAVVREVFELTTLTRDPEPATFETQIKNGWNRTNLNVVAWIQDTSTLKVHGAATAKLK